MKKVLKWILGIVVGLVVIAVVLGAGYMVARRFGGFYTMRESRLVQRSGPLQDLPRQRTPGQLVPNQKMPRNFERNEMPMYYYGGMGYRPLGGLMLAGRLVGGVFRLAFLGLVIFLAVTLALRQKQVKQTATVSPAEPAMGPTQAGMMSCPHCAREIQADWKHCPYCGNSLEPTQPDVPVT
jgi:zinc-ribbon domain